MKKNIEIRFDREAYREFIRLEKAIKQQKTDKTNPTNLQLFNSIKKVLDKIRDNPYCGKLVPRKYLNRRIIKTYGTDKILRIELIGYWRLLYTLIGEEAKIIAFVLEFMDHKKYNNIFGYRKR